MLALAYLLFTSVSSDAYPHPGPDPVYIVDDLPVLNETECGHCYRVYVPVCASDNKTYINECRMRCSYVGAAVEDMPHIVMYGPCIRFARRSDWIGYNETSNNTVDESLYFEDY